MKIDEMFYYKGQIEPIEYPKFRLDRSKWEPCEHCKPAEYPPDKFGAHEFPIVGNEIYYHDTDDGWEGQKINFCPWCGCPLTEVAWAELERRLTASEPPNQIKNQLDGLADLHDHEHSGLLEE